jgi:Recombination endonuclease VII
VCWAPIPASHDLQSLTLRRIWLIAVACNFNKLYPSVVDTNELPPTRTAARALGLKHYFTGRPCSKGHLEKRHLTGTCVECGRAAVKRWEQRNPGEGNRRSREWQQRNPEKARLRSLKSKRKAMGIPEATHACPTRCECCSVLLVQGKNIHLDHCHLTGKFRGWLCNRCNRGLGYFDDCIEGLEKAIAYLRKANLRRPVA